MNETKLTYDNLYSVSERKELIAESLKTFRTIKKMTQKEVAEHIGLSAQTYATYERGRNEPPAEILVRLSFLYDVPLEFLVQKNNMNKDKFSIKKQFDELDAIIDEAKAKILSGDKETREQLKRLTDGLEGFVDMCKKELVQKD